ncbi:hypothetical protein [Photorhabdus temperata]|uniref:Uncharacterized protein n=1 Tax=Photorhabdus temperata J3 TaxID=1389415 RepID=U7R662_PHOTE|nr:hypothetical protein [Photorhabdus temperata]ERT14912.1 hypothetical protein O185_01225 [Photorhabdus temperata J3]
MSDWRTNPRQGRSQFLPLLDEIKQRLALGETIKMIFESYPNLKISYPQFTRYIKKYCAAETYKTVSKKTDDINESKEDVAKETSRITIRNPADLRKLRNQSIDLEELKNSLGDENESSDS